MSMQGTYETLHGKPAVRFERRLDHGIEHVWRGLTEAEELRHWFPCEVELELRVGGSMRFTFAPDFDLDGEVLELEPPRIFVFRWGEDILRFELTAQEDGTDLVMLHVLNEEGAPSAAKVAAGWHLCLEALDERLAGRRDGPAPSGVSPEWLARYDGYVSDGMPSGAAVPGLAEAPPR